MDSSLLHSFRQWLAIIHAWCLSLPDWSLQFTLGYRGNSTGSRSRSDSVSAPGLQSRAQASTTRGLGTLAARPTNANRNTQRNVGVIWKWWLINILKGMRTSTFRCRLIGRGCMAKEEFLESDRAPAQYISERVRMGFGSRCIYRINEAGDGWNNYGISDDIINVRGILNVWFKYRITLRISYLDFKTRTNPNEIYFIPLKFKLLLKISLK